MSSGDPAFPMNQVGEQTLTVSTTAVTLTLPTGGGRTLRPNHALIYVRGTAGEGVRWLASGTVPTGTAGILVLTGNYIDWTDPNVAFFGVIKGAQFIRNSTNASDITLDIAYFG